MQVAVPRLASVRSSAELDGTLRSMMRAGADSTVPTMGLKTFVADLDDACVPVSRWPGIRWDEARTGVAGLTVLTPRDLGGLAPRCHNGPKLVPDCDLYLDRRAGRFCFVHVMATDRVADHAMALLVNTTPVNRAWIGPRALGACVGAWRRGGNGHNGARRQSTRMAGGRTVLGTIRAVHADDGADFAEVDADCDGWIAARRGTSVESHMRLADAMRGAYAQMAAVIEECSTGFNISGDDHDIGGGISIEFSHEIEDMQWCVDVVFGNAWLPRILKKHIDGGDGYYGVIPALDLESATTMDTAIATKRGLPPRLLVTLRKEYPASATLWLLARVQMHHDAGATCVELTTGRCSG